MTCCLVAVLLMERVVRFFGRPWKILLGRSGNPASVPPALGTWSQAVLGSASTAQVPRRLKWRLLPAIVAELTAAWLVWLWLATGAGAQAEQTETHDVATSAHHHEMAHAAVQGAGWLTASTVVLVVGSVLLGMTCNALIRQRSSRFLTGLGVACCLVGIVPVPASGASLVHVVAMIQLELSILAAPALLAFAWIGRGGRSLNSARNSVDSTSAAILSTVALPLVTLAWHIPSIDAALSGTGLSALVRPASFLVCGLALWGYAVHRPSDGRSMTGGRMLLLAYGASSLIGIAMILGPAALMSGDHPSGLLVNSLTDQRLAGLVMMLADILVVFPALRKWISDAGSVPALSHGLPA
jgi:hypothetical protein